MEWNGMGWDGIGWDEIGVPVLETPSDTSYFACCMLTLYKTSLRSRPKPQVTAWSERWDAAMCCLYCKLAATSVARRVLKGMPSTKFCAFLEEAVRSRSPAPDS